MNTRTEAKFNFTVTGPGRSFGVWHDDADVTEAFWGDEVPEPLTQAEIIGLVGCFSENSPIAWGDTTYGTWGTFTSPVDPDIGELGTYLLTLDEVTDQLTIADHEGMPDECDADDCRSNATHIERIEGLNWYLCDAHESRFWTGPSPEQIETEQA